VTKLTRGLTRAVLLIVVPCAAVAAGVMFWLWGGRYIATENAYVKADIVQVTAEIAGRATAVHIRDHGTVKAGDLLFEIDREPFEMALAKAEAELDQTKTQVEVFRAQLAEANAELKEAQSKVAFFDAQLGRQKQLVAKGVGAAFRFEEAESNSATARDRVAVVRQKITRLAALLGNDPKLPAERHPMVREKMAERDRARLELARTKVVASVSGVAVNVKLQPGEQIRALTPLFAIVSDNRPWVEANFKETELTHVRPGQLATVVLDIYPDVEWKAEIDTISPATGAEFALLPPQNASGNWVKVVQRLPVKLRLQPRPGEPPLRAGMTATVRVDTERQRSLSQLLGGIASAMGRQKDAKPEQAAATK
jgi:membrane fusion protein (multidrug efflux system)